MTASKIGRTGTWKLTLQIAAHLYSRIVLGGTAAFLIPSGMREAAFSCTFGLAPVTLVGRHLSLAAEMPFDGIIRTYRQESDSSEKFSR